MHRTRALAMAATTFLLGAALALGLLGPGCGGGSEQVFAQSVPIEFVDMTFGGEVPIVAQVGSATLRGTLDGHIDLDPTTGLMNGQVTALFDDGLQVQCVFRDSAVQLDVPGTTVLIGNDDSDVVLVNGRSKDMREMVRALFEGLQQDPRPSVQLPENSALTPFWLLRLTWAWFVNEWAAQTTPGGRPLAEIGTSVIKRFQCMVTVPILVRSFEMGGCGDLEQRCANQQWITIGGIRIPCKWILAMCVNGQYVGGDGDVPYAAWLLFADE